MFESLNKIQKISKKIDNLLLRGLGFMIIIIFVVGISSIKTASDVNISNEKTNTTQKSIQTNYKNCIFSNTTKYIPLTQNLKTNIDKSLIDIIGDTDNNELGKAGVVSLLNPKTINIDKAINCINSKDEVFIVIYDNIVKIYPKNLLNHHQLINDSFNSTNILISYSPLSNSTTAFIRNDNEFEISGRVFKGNTLMYDKKTESLWLQLTGKAVIGDKTGEKLIQIVIQNSSFINAMNSFPNAQFVSYDTGYDYNYSIDPYKNFKNTSLPFGEIDTSEYISNPKDIGLSFIIDDKPYYYSIAEIENINFNSLNFEIIKNPQLQTFEVLKKINNQKIIVPFTNVYYYSFKEIYNNKNLY